MQKTEDKWYPIHHLQANWLFLIRRLHGGLSVNLCPPTLRDQKSVLYIHRGQCLPETRWEDRTETSTPFRYVSLGSNFTPLSSSTKSFRSLTRIAWNKSLSDGLWCNPNISTRWAASRTEWRPTRSPRLPWWRRRGVRSDRSGDEVADHLLQTVQDWNKHFTNIQWG